MSTHLLLVVQTALLVAISLAVLYPVVAYSRSVLHTEAVVALAVSLLAFTVGSLIEQWLGMATAAEGVYLLSAGLFAITVWLFAREFVRPGESAFETEDGGTPGVTPRFTDASDAEAPSGFADAPDEAGDGFASATETDADGGFAAATEGDDGE